MKRDCNNCGGSEWVQVHTETYTGHKHTNTDNERRKRVFACTDCDSEGRVFDKGPSGETIYSGAMR